MVNDAVAGARDTALGMLAAYFRAKSWLFSEGANSADTAGTPPPEGGDNDKGDKQKKGKPERNVDQNKRVDDAAREVGLDKQQRRELGRYIEQGSRKYGENFSYSDIVDAAERIKGGERLINIK